MSLRSAELAGLIAGCVIGALVLCTLVCYQCTKKRPSRLTKAGPVFSTSADHAESGFEATHPARGTASR